MGVGVKIFKNVYIRNSLIVAALVLGYVYIYNILSVGVGVGHCPFKLVTGIPCPGCGGIRSTYQLLHGNVVDAVLINPLSILVNVFILLSVGWLVRDMFVGRDSYFTFMKNKRLGKSASIVAILVVIAVWVINIVRYFNN